MLFSFPNERKQYSARVVECTTNQSRSFESVCVSVDQAWAGYIACVSRVSTIKNTQKNDEGYAHTLVFTLVPLCLGNHGFVAKALKLLLDEIKPFGHTGTATWDHGTVVVNS